MLPHSWLRGRLWNHNNVLEAVNMISGRILRSKRAAAGISGELVAMRVSLDRGRLSRIERGLLVASPEELQRIDSAIRELADAKREIERFAVSKGWPLEALA